MRTFTNPSRAGHGGGRGPTSIDGPLQRPNARPDRHSPLLLCKRPISPFMQRGMSERWHAHPRRHGTLPRRSSPDPIQVDRGLANADRVRLDGALEMVADQTSEKPRRSSFEEGEYRGLIGWLIGSECDLVTSRPGVDYALRPVSCVEVERAAKGSDLQPVPHL